MELIVESGRCENQKQWKATIEACRNYRLNSKELIKTKTEFIPDKIFPTFGKVNEL